MDSAILKLRADVNGAIRGYFSEHGVLEVTTPVLGRTSVPDVHIDSVTLSLDGESRYLQTSPEYFMKRLLADGAGAIYQIGPVFRAGERGRHHNTEFTMLEWYRPGYSLEALADEVEALLGRVASACGTSIDSLRRTTYHQQFEARYGINPHVAETAALARLARETFPEEVAHIEDHGDDATRNDWLDLLFSCGIEESLEDGLVFDYPSTQAALARVEHDGSANPVARRFEAFLNGREIANAYDELNDEIEVRRRFENFNRMRRVRGKPEMPLDESMLQAIGRLPPTAGVALGVDRLVQYLAGVDTLDAVLPFGDRRL